MWFEIGWWMWVLCIRSSSWAVTMSVNGCDLALESVISTMMFVGRFTIALVH